MKKLATALIAAAAVSGATASRAATGALDNPTGPYVGGGFGQFSLDIDDLDEFGEAVESIAEDEDTSWKIFGGWRFGPYFAIEAAYIDLGNAEEGITSGGSNGTYSLAIDGFAPAIIGTFPLGPVELFGKVGYYLYDVDVRTNFGGSGPDSLSANSSGDDVIYGGGLGLTFFERLHVRAEYEIFDLEGLENSNALWLSAAWRF